MIFTKSLKQMKRLITMEHIREERQRNLEKEIKKYADYYFGAGELQDFQKQGQYLDKYHRLQATYMHRYGNYYQMHGQTKLSLQEIRDRNDRGVIWIRN